MIGMVDELASQVVCQQNCSGVWVRSLVDADDTAGCDTHHDHSAVSAPIEGTCQGKAVGASMLHKVGVAKGVIGTLYNFFFDHHAGEQANCVSDEGVSWLHPVLTVGASITLKRT